jgi:hypothetical protein
VLHICAIQPLCSQVSEQFRMMLTLIKPLDSCDTCLPAGSRCQTEGPACYFGSLVVSEVALLRVDACWHADKVQALSGDRESDHPWRSVRLMKESFDAASSAYLIFSSSKRVGYGLVPRSARYGQGCSSRYLRILWIRATTISAAASTLKNKKYASAHYAREAWNEQRS